MRQSQNKAHSSDSNENQDKESMTIQEWLTEARKTMDDLKEYEQEAAAIQTRIKLSNNTQEKQTLDSLIETINGTRKEIEEHLGVIRDLIPVEYKNPKESILEEELTSLRNSYSKYRRESIPETRESKLINLLNEWKIVAGNAPDFVDFMVDRANIVGATCLFSASKAIADDLFDWVIVDEAGRATPPELLTALVKARRAVLVGDDKQLPPFVDQEYTDEDLHASGMGEAGRKYLETSLFEMIVKQASQEKPEIVCMLKTQHRMHPAIGQLVSDVFYGGQLISKTDPVTLAHGLKWIPSPVVWYSTSILPNRTESKRGSSSLNVTEATIVKALLGKIETDYRKSNMKCSVGVISGYEAQIQELNTHIAPDDHDAWQSLNVEIDTVDGFQGRECDIVIYSTVRSNREGKIGFLKDPRRINVALSRARKLLIIVGDIVSMENASLSRALNPFSQVIKYMRSHPENCQIANWNENNGNQF